MTKKQAVRIDSRKFLSTINNSAQSRIAFFESRVKEMGRQAGRRWQLVSLNESDLYFEDVGDNKYFVAEHTADHGKVEIANIRPVEIVEEQKAQVFQEACLKLVNAIEENDQRAMAAMFNTMKKHRFSSRVVPFSGVVRCRDGIARHISVMGDNIGEDVKDKLVAAIVESLQDRVIVENGEVTAASFNDGVQFRLPVTKWASRKLVARKMRDVANNAYWSEGFQKRILNVAALISEGKIEEAVKNITPFLDDKEEFTLLTRGQVQTLVENALATKAIFNQQLCNDVAKLFYRTNMRVSRSKIIDEWRAIARKSEHPVLAENVQILSESRDFETTYDKFLDLIFEAISNREVAAEALATTLTVLKDKTPKIRESVELSTKLDSLINRLKTPNFDDAAIYEAEDLIATIQEELAANDTLSSFDQMPGDTTGGLGGGGAAGGGAADAGLASELTADLGGDKGASGAPVININSPLIQIGGSSGAGGEAPMGEEPAPDFGGGEELGDEINAEQTDMGGGEQQDVADLMGGGGFGEGRRRRGRAVSESRPVHAEMKTDDDIDADQHLADDEDPYAVKESININVARLNEYGAPVITDSNDLHRIVKIMGKLAKEHKLTGKRLAENLERMALAGIQAIGLRIPDGKLPKAIDQAIELFESEGPFPGAAPPFGKDKDEDGDDAEKDTGEKPDFVEDQFKGPRRRGVNAGRKRSAYAPRELKNESIQWGESQSDAIAGAIGGVRFIFDHGGDAGLAPVVLSKDGQIEIPIPEDVCPAAFASVTGKGDSTRFVKWLRESIEQLRPITAEEDRQLQEAMAKITTTPDGQISVEVTDDVGVGQVGDENGMGADTDDVNAELGGDEGMAPVDSVDAAGPTGDVENDMEASEESMPDFEGGQTEGQPPAQGAPQQGAPQQQGAPPQNGQPAPEDKEPAFEDKDITSPKSAKYTKHVTDNKREMPTVKPTKKTDDTLEDIGPELKKDDGSGTNPPVAKKSGD